MNQLIHLQCQDLLSSDKFQRQKFLCCGFSCVKRLAVIELWVYTVQEITEKKLVDDGPLSRIARAPQNLTYLFTYLLSTLKACSQPPNGNSIELEFSTVQFSLVRRLWTFLEWKPRNRGLTADRNFSWSTRGGCAPSSTDVISARTTANGLLASDPVRLQFTPPPRRRVWVVPALIASTNSTARRYGVASKPTTQP